MADVRGVPRWPRPGGRPGHGEIRDPAPRPVALRERGSSPTALHGSVTYAEKSRTRAPPPLAAWQLSWLFPSSFN